MKNSVIGIGNTLRRDDGAGCAVADWLVDKLPEDVTILRHHGEGTSLMDSWRGAERVVLVDATRSGILPGAVRRWDAGATELPAECFHYSSHVFGVAEAVALARELNRLPAGLIVYGIEGATFGYGEGLSAPVARAVTRVAKMVIAEFSGRNIEGSR